MNAARHLRFLSLFLTVAAAGSACSVTTTPPPCSGSCGEAGTPDSQVDAEPDAPLPPADAGDASTPDAADASPPEVILPPPAGAVGTLVGPSTRPVRIAANAGSRGVLWATAGSAIDAADGELYSLPLTAGPAVPVMLLAGVANLDYVTATGEQYCWGSPGTVAASHADGFVSCSRPGGTVTLPVASMSGLSQSGNRVHFVMRKGVGEFALQSIDLSQFLPGPSPVERLAFPVPDMGVVPVGTATRTDGSLAMIDSLGKLALFLPDYSIGGGATVTNGGPAPTRAEVASNAAGTVMATCTGGTVTFATATGRTRTLARNACGQIGVSDTEAYFPITVAGKSYIARAALTGPIQLVVETSALALAIDVSSGRVYWSEATGLFSIPR